MDISDVQYIYMHVHVHRTLVQVSMLAMVTFLRKSPFRCVASSLKFSRGMTLGVERRGLKGGAAGMIAALDCERGGEGGRGRGGEGEREGGRKKGERERER